MNNVEITGKLCYHYNGSGVLIGGIKVDRVTQSFIEDFKKNNELLIDDISTLFEYFTNYCIVSKENGSEDIDLEEITTGKATQGIDGIAVIVNGKLVNSINEIDSLIKINKTLKVKFVLIQSKTSEHFDNTEIGNFFNFTSLFFNGDSSIFVTEEMKKFIELKDHIYLNSMHMRDSNPELIMYYVTAGNWTQDLSINSIIEINKQSLRKTNLFSLVEFIPCGAAEIQKLYRKTQSDLTATFKFEKKITMFSNEDGEVGYYGVLPFSEYRKIIIDDGNVLKPVFEDNIRDFLGTNNDVNHAIEETINCNNIYSFSMLNNGITVVADSATAAGDILTINNYQIVNGCQTSHMLFQNKDNPNISSLMVPLRIIITKNEELKNNITKATNNQTAIKKEQLEALSTFQKNLEEYYKSFSKEEERLYYERRTGQYRNMPIPRAKMVSIPYQIKTVSAMFLNNPHGVSGQYGTIAKDVGSKIFKNTDRQIIYYTSSLALYRIESLFKNGSLNKSYRKARYHTMMLLRIVISGKDLPKFNQKKMESYCQKILDVLNDDSKCLAIYKGIIDYIVSQKEQIKFGDRKVFERKETTDYLLSKSDELVHFLQTNEII